MVFGHAIKANKKNNRDMKEIKCATLKRKF